MKPTRSESPPVRVAVFASIAGGRRTPATPVERALRDARPAAPAIARPLRTSPATALRGRAAERSGSVS